MKTDWKALCQKLLIDNVVDEYEQHLYRSVLADRARAALAAEPVGEGPTDEELKALAGEHSWDDPNDWIDYIAFARAVLARWGHQPAPPAEGEVAEIVDHIRAELQGFHPRHRVFGEMTVARLSRAADLLEQRHPAPVPVSERLPGHIEQALIKAECALSDIAEGEPEENEGDSDALLSWAEQRAAAVLARIRPVMRRHGIRTSEWPSLPATALPLPAGEVQP